MAANQGRCPSVEELERLLAEELSGPERDAVEAHVEGCAPCQEQLARLCAPTFHLAATNVAATAFPNEAGTSLEPGEGFLHRLREMAPPASGVSGVAESPPAASRAASDAGPFPGARLGRYEILEKLASGGMGAVYKARHVELGKVVALKVLPAGEMNELTLARFKNEMRAIGRLDHPHIVAAHDAGDADGVHYLAMDFVDGVDLARLVKRHGRLSVSDACEAIRQAALGLQHAFERGLVHRDVKPSNLMLARSGLVQLLDLGLARACEDTPSETLTSRGTLLGTADYLAPEQWEHPHAADVRADIYGLGCTLYHLLAGQPPFSGPRYGTVFKKMRGHFEDMPAPVAQFCEVPAGLAAILERMLAKNPADRFASPDEVAAALAPFAAGADLASLPGPADAGEAPASASSLQRDTADTERPVQALLDTHQSGNPSPSPAARRYVRPVALIGCLGLFLIAAFLWPGFWRSAAPAKLEVTELRVDHYRDGGLLGDLRTSHFSVRLEDSVEVSAKLSVPAYYYLIAFNPKGGEGGIIQLCLPEGEDSKEAADDRPEKSKEVRYPRKHKFVLDAAGLQVLVLAASTKPLPAYAEWQLQFDTIPWDGTAAGGDARWHFDGQEFTRIIPRERGRLEPKENVPRPLRDLCDFFKGRTEFDAIQVIAFPVVKATGSPPDPGAAKKPDSPPQLSKAGVEWVNKKYAEAVEFGRAGQWGHDEAQAPVREILDFCTRVLGKDHYITADYRREIEALKQLTELPEANRIEYLKTYPLYDELDGFWKKDHYTEAQRPAEEILEIYRRLLGPESTYVAMAASRYGKLLYHGLRYAEAEKQLRAALRIYRKVVGEENWAVAEATGYLALALEKLGQDAEARDLYEKALKLTARLLGEDHFATAVAVNNLAGHLDRQALFGEAEKLHRRAVAALRKCAEDDGRLLANACNNLALNLQNQGRYEEAEALYQEALNIRRRLTGEDHPDTGRVYMNLGTNRQAQGDLAGSEPLLRKALETYRSGYGPTHPETAWALNNLAVNLNTQGKNAEAAELLREALAVILRAPGEQSRAVAKFSSNLASCLRDQEKYAEAEALCEKSLSALRERLEADHPDVAAALNNLAATLEDQDRFADAERRFREAQALMERRPGANHPETALGRVNLSVNLYHQGKYAEAEPLLRSALCTYQGVLGEGHPSTAWTYKNLIGNACARGDYAQAEALAEAATASFEAARLRLGFAGLDRARRTSDISPLTGLAVAAARRDKPGAASQAWERNLARGLLDDLAPRRLSDEDRRREEMLAEKLNLMDRRVELLRARGPDVDEDRRNAEKDRDAVQRELVQLQADLATRYGVVAGQVYDLTRIQKQLPEDAALVAWVDLPNSPNWADPKGDHWACLVRHRGEPVWVQLSGSGDNGAWTDADDRLPARVRRAVAARPDDPTAEWRELVGKLHAQRLAPLAKHLGAVRHLVVLPSGRMAGIPVEALTAPGAAAQLATGISVQALPDRFTVSYAPSGTMFAWLRKQKPRQSVGRSPSLLALGDPAFEAAQGTRERGTAFAALPGTRQELASIARVFEEPILLMGSKASEQQLDQLAAAEGGLRKFAYLHFATHGVLDDRSPMHSALILARDRLPDPLQQALKGAEAYNGRLTAGQILRRWQLDAELVTLSACNTALGKFRDGEGFVGFSQALFLSGARSLVLSLWQVDDAATALLMTRFYENLIGTKTPAGEVIGPMPKAEALAEAKRWLRSLGPEEARELTRDLPRLGTRGRIVPKKEGPVQTTRTFEHPYYWAGFILLGDPR